MKLATARMPVSPISPTTFILTWGVGATLIVLVAAQLIMYEKFVPFMQSFNMFGNPAFSETFAAGMVIVEVMALPFLLRMNLSKLLRTISAGCLLVAGLAWTFLGYWSMMRPFNSTANTFEAILTHGNGFIMPFGLILLIAGCFITFRLRADLRP